MDDLFRYIEHQFVVPTAVPSVNVESQSVSQQIRSAASDFLARDFPSGSADPIGLDAALTAFKATLAATQDITGGALDPIVKEIFGRSARQLATSAEIKVDREFVENALLAVRLATAFSAVGAGRQMARSSLTFERRTVARRHCV